MMSNTVRFAKEAFKSWRTPDSYKLEFVDFNQSYKLRENPTIKPIDVDDNRRILNPPLFFVNNNDFVENEINISIGKPVKVFVAKTSHGVYIKPYEQVYNSQFEYMFGFGLCCSGFDPNRVVYYPSYEKEKPTSFAQALEENCNDPNIGDTNPKKYLKYKKGIFE